MSRIIPYQWIRGSSLSFALQVQSGSVLGSEVLRVVGKSIAALGSPPPGDAAPDAVVFTTVFVPPAGKVPAHWLITATSAQGLSVPPGFLIVDARIDFGSGIIVQTDPCYFDVHERVTEAS